MGAGREVNANTSRHARLWCGILLAKQQEVSLARLHRPSRLFPGVNATGDMGRIGQSRFLRGVHRHRRALAIGAEEHDAPSGGGRDLTQHPARFEALADSGIGRMQRAGQRAVLGALARFAQIDQQDVGPAETLDRLISGERQSLDRKSVV